MNREKIIQSIKELPEEFEVEELMEHILFKEKVEQGLKQLDEGKIKSHEEVEQLVSKW